MRLPVPEDSNEGLLGYIFAGYFTRKSCFVIQDGFEPSLASRGTSSPDENPNLKP